MLVLAKSNLILAHYFAFSRAPLVYKCTHNNKQQTTNKTAAFNTMQSKTYAIASSHLPLEMNVCKNNNVQPTRNVALVASPGSSGIVMASEVSAQCGGDSVCIVPSGITVWMVGVIGLNVGALIVRGVVEWNDNESAPGGRGAAALFLCAGYVAVEGRGRFTMDVRSKSAYVYIKDNGAVHAHLRSRAFGGVAMSTADYPVVEISGRELARTWSLLSKPLVVGDGEC